jgi:4-amino-4-deoxy-L-arabinose transferase-like glycosyltransferase
MRDAVRGRAFVPRLALPNWSGSAWGAIGLAAAFIALTWWWLTQDRSIPIYDAGYDLETTIEYHNMLHSGNLLGPFNNVLQYPPLGFLVGAFAMFIGRVNVSSPIVGENLVFVSLLTLGCYQTGKLLFGSRAGLLAAIFALGSPLLIAQFHVFMLDAPETALVAVSIWLILASERFSKVKMSGFAGLAVAAGLLIKVQFPFFILGIVLCALVRGGWRNWWGFSTFTGVAVLFGSPWYIRHLSELQEITRLAGTSSGAVAENLPPTFSVHNLTWYLWSILNSQLLVVLFALLVVGVLWTAVILARRNGEALGGRLEFFVGGVVAWLAITLTPHHDVRYGMPLLPYMAVIATGWMVFLPRPARPVAVGVLVAGVILNTISTTFGLGGQVQLGVGHSISSTYLLPTTVVLYSNAGFLVSGPQRDGDVPGLLEALRRDGVRTVAWSLEESRGSDFSFEGLIPLALIAKLTPIITQGRRFSDSSDVATLVHQSISSHGPSPCARLSDGTGVFVVRYRPSSGRLMLYCPYRDPSFYQP